MVGDSARELDRRKQTRNGVVGLPRKYLEGKARDMANQEEWVSFADMLALLIFGVVIFFQKFWKLLIKFHFLRLKKKNITLGC